MVRQSFTGQPEGDPTVTKQTFVFPPAAMCRFLFSFISIIFLFLDYCHIISSSSSFSSSSFQGFTRKEAFDSGITLAQLGRDSEAAEAFWNAILGYPNSQNSYSHEGSVDAIDGSAREGEGIGFDPRIALEQFMATFHRRGIPEQGLLRLAKQWKVQGLEKESIEYLEMVVSMNPKLVEAYLLLASMQSLEPNIRLKHIISALMIDPEGYHVSRHTTCISCLRSDSSVPFSLPPPAD
jgi:tetratricopeptide (TPR) repeat protein